MHILLDLISSLGKFLIFITPLTLGIGIINSIKKTGNESLFYIIITIISLYLILIPLFV